MKSQLLPQLQRSSLSTFTYIVQDKWLWVHFAHLKQTINYTNNDENMWYPSYSKSETGNNFVRVSNEINKVRISFNWKHD